LVKHYRAQENHTKSGPSENPCTEELRLATDWTDASGSGQQINQCDTQTSSFNICYE